MWVCGTWIRTYYVLCSKTYSTLGGLFWTPAGWWWATRGAHICETRLIDSETYEIVSPNSMTGEFVSLWKWTHLGILTLTLTHTVYKTNRNGSCLVNFKILFMTYISTSKFHPLSLWILVKHVFNTLRPRQNGRHFADDIFKCIFLNGNVWILVKISLEYVPKGPSNNIPALVQIMAWRRSGDKPLSEPMMVDLPMHICVTQPQWVKGMWHGDGAARDAVAVALWLWKLWHTIPLWRDSVWIQIVLSHYASIWYEYSLEKFNHPWVIHNNDPHPLKTVNYIGACVMIMCIEFLWKLFYRPFMKYQSLTSFYHNMLWCCNH